MPFFEHLIQPVQKRLAENAAPAGFEFFTHINDRDRRQTATTGRIVEELDTLRQFQPQAFPGFSLVALLDGGRGRPQNANRAAQPGIDFSGFHSVIERRFGLVIGTIVTLIRHDQPNIR